MPNNNTVDDQQYVPTCLHWQVAQSTSLQNIYFNMIQGSDKQVGIFMENGSGGFLSDLTFFGGQIGFRAGSQQFTLRGLKFVNPATAISMIWNWGMVRALNEHLYPSNSQLTYTSFLQGMEECRHHFRIRRH
jgi:hypothetical protein